MKKKLKIHLIRRFNFCIAVLLPVAKFTPDFGHHSEVPPAVPCDSYCRDEPDDLPAAAHFCGPAPPFPDLLTAVLRTTISTHFAGRAAS
jgi:hypothetical protein